MLVLLKGITRHGKNRVHQHGNTWRIAGEGKHKGQEAWNLESLEKPLTIGHARKEFDGRWVLKQDDPNFEIKIKE